VSILSFTYHSEHGGWRMTVVPREMQITTLINASSRSQQGLLICGNNIRYAGTTDRSCQSG